MDWFLVKFCVEGLCWDLWNHLEFDTGGTEYALPIRK